MKTNTAIRPLFLLLLLSALGSACKKEKNSPPPVEETPVPVANPRQVTYQISGSYSGYLFVVYYDNVSGNKTDTVKSLPWSKEITYAAGVSGIGIAANAVSGHFGAASQSATIKILSAGNVVKSQSGNTEADGSINIQSVAYVFP